MKKIYLLIISFIFISFAKTQVKNLGLPLTFKSEIKKTSSFYVTPKFSIEEQIAKDEEERIKSNNKVFRFGKEFEVDLNVFELGEKLELPNGDFLYQYGIHCSGATSISLIFNQFKLAEGVYIYIADEKEKDFDGAYTNINNNNANVLGTDIVYSEQVIVEVYVPKEKVNQSSLNIGTIIFGYKDLNKMMEKAFGSAGNCHIDVNCPLGLGWENQRNSVAMMMNGGGFCTGSLVNNTSGTIIPYFLTANHCGTNPTNWVFRFRWESPANGADCGTSQASAQGPETMNVNGAVLRAYNADSDFTLVELNTAPDPAWGIYYNGWDRSGIASTQNTGIHHPSGDIKKISRDENGASESTWNGTSTYSHWRVPSWDQGVTEGGSSGSPLFDQNHRVVGQLHGGGSACGNNTSNLWDDYGKFSRSWTGGGTNSTRLSNWLDPINIGSIYIDGVDPTVPNNQVDAAIGAPEGVNGRICSTTTASPKVTILNSGSQNLTSATINYGFDGVNTLSYNWTGNLNLFQSEVVTLPTLNIGTGNHTFWAEVTNPNNSTDQNLMNNETSSSFTIITNGEKDTLFLYTDKYGNEVQWNIKDQNNTILYSGGPYEELDTCGTNLIKQGTCLAYGCYTFTILDEYGDGLSNAECPDYKGSYSFKRPDYTSVFGITSAESNYQFSKTHNFCIQDDLSIDKITDIENSLFIFPNPFTDEISINTNSIIQQKIEVYNVLGNKIIEKNTNSTLSKIHLNYLENGVYLVKVYTDKGAIIKNIVKR